MKIMTTKNGYDYIILDRRAFIFSEDNEEFQEWLNGYGVDAATFMTINFGVSIKDLEIVATPELKVLEHILGKDKLDSEQMQEVVAIIKNVDRAFVGVNTFLMYKLTYIERIVVSEMNNNRRKLLTQFLTEKGKKVISKHRLVLLNSIADTNGETVSITKNGIQVSKAFQENKNFLHVRNDRFVMGYDVNLIPFAILNKMDYFKVLSYYNLPNDSEILNVIDSPKLMWEANKYEAASQYMQIMLGTMSTQNTNSINPLGYFLSKIIRSIIGLETFAHYTFDNTDKVVVVYSDNFPAQLITRMEDSHDYMVKVLKKFDSSHMGVADNTIFLQLLMSEHIVDSLIGFNDGILVRAVAALSDESRLFTVKAIYEYLCTCLNLDTTVEVTDEDEFIDTMLNFITGSLLVEASQQVK